MTRTQSDHAAESFFATSNRDRMSRWEQRLFDKYRAASDEALRKQIIAYTKARRQEHI